MAVALHTLYKGEFCDKSGETIFIEFKRLHEDNGQPVVPIQLIFAGHDDQPLVISYKEDGDYKITPINGSEVTVNIKATQNSGFELSDMYTENERDWLIVISGAWNHSAWLIPDSCSEPYNSKPYDVTIRATDALGTLKDTPFLDANGSRYNGFYSDVAVLREIFLKTGLPLDIGIAVNTFESQMNTAICPLSQTFINTARFLDADNNPFSCEEVLRSILQRWSARLHQFNGKWQIVNTLELSSGSPIVMWNFDYLGVTKTSSTIGNSSVAGGRDKPLIPVDATNSITKAFKSSTAYYQYGYPTNELVNGDFNDWASPMVLPNHWVAQGGAVASTGTSAQRPDDHFLIITSSAGNGRRVINDTEVQVRATESVEIRFDVISNGGNASPSDRLYMSILLQTDDGRWYTETGWKTSFAYYVIVRDAGDWLNQTSVNFTIPAQEVDYGIVFGLKALGRANGVQIETQFNNAQVKPSVNSGQTKPPLGIFTRLTLLSAQTYVPDPILLLHGDEFNAQRTSQIKINNTSIPVYWTRLNTSEQKTLLQLVAETELRQHQRPYKIFEGTFEGLGNIDINTVLSVELLSGLYIFMSGDFDLKRGNHKLRLAETITGAISPYTEQTAQDYGSIKGNKGVAVGLPEGVSVPSGGANQPDLVGYATIGDIPVKATAVETQSGIDDENFITPFKLLGWWTVAKTQIPKGSDGVLNKSANYTIVVGDFGTNGNVSIYVDTTSGNVNITLPTALLMNGYTANIIKVSSDTNSVNVIGTINGITNDLLSNQFDSAIYKSNGTNFYKF